ARELIIDIVDVTGAKDLRVAQHHGIPAYGVAAGRRVQVGRRACTRPGIEFPEKTFAPVLFKPDVDALGPRHVFNSREPGLVALAIEGLHLVDDIGGQVLSRGPGVTEKEFLPVEIDLVHFFALHRHVTVLVDVDPRQLTKQILQRCVGLGRVSACIKGNGIVAYDHRWDAGGDHHLHHGLVGTLHPQLYMGNDRSGYVEVQRIGLKTEIGAHDPITSCGQIAENETAWAVAPDGKQPAGGLLVHHIQIYSGFFEYRTGEAIADGAIDQALG